jgi:hypothetical protein
MPPDVTTLVQHLRHELDTDPYPLGPRLDPLKRILARPEPPRRHRSRHCQGSRRPTAKRRRRWLLKDLITATPAASTARMTMPPEDDPRLFAPGTHGCHEALHVALMFAEIVDEYLVRHPAIKAKPEWAAQAETGTLQPLSSYRSRPSRARLKKRWPNGPPVTLADDTAAARPSKGITGPVRRPRSRRAGDEAARPRAG